MTRLTICMYGAASDRINSIYINAANELGKEIAKRHHKLIYGGGAGGLMGACASGVLENGGEVTGVVPTFMNKFEPIKSECTEIVRTETMSLRKEVMEENADAFVIAPGGIGTFDDLAEAQSRSLYITWPVSMMTRLQILINLSAWASSANP